MKPAIFRILILRLAGTTHFEGRHGGGRAVVGYVADDCVARTAVGAIGEGVAIAPVRRVAKIPPTSLPAIEDREAGACLDRNLGDGNLGNLRQLRWIFFERLEKVLHLRRETFDLDRDPGRRIKHISA